MERKITEQIDLYYDLHVPAGYNRRRKHPLLIALHGYGGNKESMMRLARRINDQDWLIAALQGPHAFFLTTKDNSTLPPTGFGWAARYKHEEAVALHHRSVLDLIEDVARDFAINRNQLFLLGFSQAVAFNYRFAFTHPDLIRGLIAVCGGIPGDREEKPYKPSKTDVLHIATDQDEYYDVNRVRSFVPWLQRQAPSVELKVYQGNHVFPRRSLRHINQWVSQRLPIFKKP